MDTLTSAPTGLMFESGGDFMTALGLNSAIVCAANHFIISKSIIYVTNVECTVGVHRGSWRTSVILLSTSAVR